MQPITDVTRHRIIGWLKKDLLTKDEARFCNRIYGWDEISNEGWDRIREINHRLRGKV
jgi:hypothetical protein